MNSTTQYRRAGEDEEEVIDDPQEYAAFKIGGGDGGRKVAALEIRTKEPRWPSLGYNWLLYTMEDGEAGTFLALIFSCMQVYVKGRNLRPVAAAVKRHRCAVLWEYHPGRWPMPADKAAPFIETITLHLPAHSAEAMAAQMESSAGETAPAITP